MKKLLSVAAVAALFAVGSAFTTQDQVQWWNVNAPRVGTPGIFQLTMAQVKQLYCPGVDNLECAYLISNPIQIVKKP